MISRLLNWVPDKQDARDVLYSRGASVSEGVLPAKVDLRAHCSPVENQEKMGSCTANALVGNLEFLEKAQAARALRLSRLFVYFNERTIEGDVDQDRGARLRDGIKALKQWGVCPEALWPYSESRLFVQPDRDAYTAALNHRISRYERITGLEDMKDCLASGFPFVFGFVVYESFMSREVASTGLAPLPSEGERVMGGHAVMAAGYDDGEQRLLCRNSWGSQWGMDGYFTLPYAYLSGKLASDFWTIRG